MNDTLADYQGQLCILYQYRMTDTPELARCFYPLGVKTREFILGYGEERIGQTMRPLGNGTYQDQSGLTYRLTDGGNTKPVHFETVPVPAPKVRKGIEVRWHNGAWEKYLKSQGWVYA